MSPLAIIYEGSYSFVLFLAVLSSLALWIIDLKYPLLLGIIIGITDIIPYFGPILGAVPTVIVAATVSVSMVIKAAIALLVLQFVESNILSPYIVGKSLRMHPVVIMLALLAGEKWRVSQGFFLAVPVLAVVRAIAIHVKPVWGEALTLFLRIRYTFSTSA
ncbi:hypothetical protein GCM10020331_036130 [Ectobacillus funiculus]